MDAQLSEGTLHTLNILHPLAATLTVLGMPLEGSQIEMKSHTLLGRMEVYGICIIPSLKFSYTQKTWLPICYWAMD